MNDVRPGYYRGYSYSGCIGREAMKPLLRPRILRCRGAEQAFPRQAGPNRARPTREVTVDHREKRLSRQPQRAGPGEGVVASMSVFTSRPGADCSKLVTQAGCASVPRRSSSGLGTGLDSSRPDGIVYLDIDHCPGEYAKWPVWVDEASRRDARQERHARQERLGLCVG